MITTRRSVMTILAGAGFALALTGCSAVGDVASAAGEGASSAAAGAARDAALSQVCGYVSDGQLSDADLQQLRAAVRAAEAAGVEGDVITRADTLLGDGGPDEGQVEQLQQACAQAGQGEPGSS
ncbi:hypothetical protein FHN55_14070 [Streptomyces sp. NP160]|uniref:hypothetical protein n=1 Tax=Streptomyces sp. NP160 TaxID=2586637 RepID=UPI00111B3652|nr:hypothetical protein [Streptomyces sp. NP160]TNM64626.1 hypothetical protein FHN55_14070 [Streptomyces sp. NP160]